MPIFPRGGKLNAIEPVFMLAEADMPALHPAFDVTYDWTSHVFMHSGASPETTRWW